MFSDSQIQELWDLGDPFRNIAVSAMMEGDRAIDWVIRHIVSPDAPEGLVRGALRRFPFLNGGFALPQAGRSSMFGDIEEEMNGFLSAVTPEAAPFCYRYFPGIRPELSELFPGLSEKEPVASRRQLMIFVTGKCNLHCPYCFSAGLAAREIPPSGLDTIFDWAQAQSVDCITPCGGEPLVYSGIDIFLDKLSKRGMECYFATNLTVDCSGMKCFDSEHIRMLFVHLTDDGLSSRRAVLENNIILAKQRGIDLIARANIIDLNTEIQPWIDFCLKNGLLRLNVALTIPGKEADHQYVSKEEMKYFIPLIDELSSACDRHGIALSFAKPIPPCIFAKEKLRWDYEKWSPLCNITEDSYSRNLCLGTDMVLTPCLGVSNPSIKFSPELSWEEVALKIGECVKEKLIAPLFPECTSCFLWKRRLCQGACLSYK